MGESEFKGWIGRSQTIHDYIDIARARALDATLQGHGHAIDTGAPLPPLWHWIYFWDVTPLSQLGLDGHPKRGGFLPPVTLPRRMWAGGRLRFLGPVPIGSKAERRSTIVRIESKSGKSGVLVFVTVRHEILVDSAVAISEEQDIVYRDHPSPGDTAPKQEPQIQRPVHWSRPLDATPLLLFRYSALTMNAHRIHYDIPYATGIEHYPDLVVHGPLAATMLAGLATANSRLAIAEFSFRGVSPILMGNTYKLCGNVNVGGADLWIAGPDERTCMTAETRWQEATDVP